MLCSVNGWPLDFMIISMRERPLHAIGRAWSRPEPVIQFDTSRRTRCGLALAAARPFKLNRWTRHRPERAEHAAIALFGTQHFAATRAFIEELAGVCRHRFSPLMTAMRAGQCALKIGFACHWFRPRRAAFLDRSYLYTEVRFSPAPASDPKRIPPDSSRSTVRTARRRPVPVHGRTFDRNGGPNRSLAYPPGVRR
jgi:hypothetical protein